TRSGSRQSCWRPSAPRSKGAAIGYGARRISWSGSRPLVAVSRLRRRQHEGRKSMSSYLNEIKARLNGVKPPTPADDQTPYGSASGEIAESSQRMKRFGGQPIEANDPDASLCNSYPAFSSPIVPGRHEGKPIVPGPAYHASRREGTQVTHSDNKKDG